MSRFFRLLTCLIFSACLSGFYSAQAISLTTGLNQCRIEHWQTDNGLPQNSVNTIVQDKDGFLWMGTDEGLARFDGAIFDVFDKRTTPPLETENVHRLFSASDGTIWIGSRTGGIFRKNPANQTAFFSIEGSGDLHVWDILEDNDGKIWIGSQKGIFLSDNFKTTPFEWNHLLKNSSIRSLHKDKSGAIWIGTVEAGIYRYQNGELTSFPNSIFYFKGQVRSIENASDGTLWFGLESDGLFSFKDGVFTHFDLIRDKVIENVHSLYLDRAGSLWVGLQHDGVARIIDSKVELLDIERGLTSNHVVDFHEDKDGNIWVGTQHGGLNRIREGRFRTFTKKDGLTDENITCIYPDKAKAGALWLGAMDGGLIYYQGSSYCAVDVGTYAQKNIRALEMGPNSEIWIGTAGGGLGIYNHKTTRFFTTEHGLPNNEITALKTVGDTLWIAMHFSLATLDLKTHKITQVDTGPIFTNDHVRCFTTDAAGVLWFGTHLGALYKYDKQRIQRVVAESSRTRQSFRSLYFDKAGTLWAGTTMAGLMMLPPGGAPYFFGVDAGLKANQVLDIFEDNQGILWFSGYRGVSRVKKTDLLAYRAGQIPKVSVQLYNEKDGIRNVEFNGGNSPSACRDLQGNLWFATRKGFATTNPDLNPPSKGKPDIFLKSILADGQRHLAGTNQLILPPGTRNLTFSYTSPQLAIPSKVAFRHRLIGLDQSWTEVGQRREVTYHNLPAGEYQFAVAARNEEGEWSATPALVSFRIIPFFYRTLWFYALATALGLTLARAVYLLRVRSLIRRKADLQAQVKSKTSELQKANLQLQGEIAERQKAAERLERNSRALEESERRFHAFMKNTPALAWMKNKRFEYAYASDAVAQISGKDSSYFIGKTDFDLFPHEVAAAFRRNDEMVFSTGQTVEVYESFPGKSGAESTFWVFKFPFVDSAGDVYVGGMAVDVTEKKRAEEVLRALPYDIIQAQETERRRVARELHDSVSQLLSAMKFRLHTAENQILIKDKNWLESYSKAKQLLDSASHQVRQISRNLRPGELDDLGLNAAIRQMVSEFQERTRITTMLHCDDLGYRLNPAVELNLFRIFQEALHNVEKHSHATELQVKLLARKGTLLFSIEDNGIGFAADPKVGHSRPSGLGMRHMQERASFMEAVFTLKTSSGNGTSITVEIPLPSGNSSNRKAENENFPVVSR